VKRCLSLCRSQPDFISGTAVTPLEDSLFRRYKLPSEALHQLSADKAPDSFALDELNNVILATPDVCQPPP